VLSVNATRIRSRAFDAPRSLVSAIALLTVFCQASNASTPDCTTSAGSFECSLLGVLHFLYAAAGILAIVLIVVLMAAIHFYRKNRDSTGDDQ
jgi:hypothetical protein